MPPAEGHITTPQKKEQLGEKKCKKKSQKKKKKKGTRNVMAMFDGNGHAPSIKKKVSQRIIIGKKNN